MKRKSIMFLSSFLLSVLFVISFTSSVGAAPASSRAKATGGVSPAKKNWQQEWDQCIAGAKKEGRVVIASSIGPEVRSSLSKAFTGKYGIEVEFLQGKPMELAPKILAERRAGIFPIDLYIAGVGTIDNVLVPAGALELIDDDLLLPEVLDRKAWWGGDLFWLDPDQHYHLMFLADPRYPIAINTNLVKNDEIKSYRDLLNPKWKGKIAWSDPTLGGAGSTAFIAMANLMDIKFLRDLGKQEQVFTRDQRIHMEWVARGKYPIGIGVKEESVTEFVKAGAPVSWNPVVEGAFIAGQGIAKMKNAPNPNAARVFLNWLLSKEGQIVASKAYGRQSAREDIPTDFLDKFMLRKPGVRYLRLDRIVAQRATEYFKTAQEMWGSSIK